MSIESQLPHVVEKTDGKVIEIHVTGKLEQQDYHRFLPKIEAMINAHGKIRILLYLNEFAGWTASALWSDIKFDLKHFNDIERLAIVGESKWQEGMATFCKPFTTAEIRYFTHDQLPDARQWINAG